MSREQYVEEIGTGMWRGRFTGQPYDHRNIAGAETWERREAERQQAMSQPSPEAEIERLVAPGSSFTLSETAIRLRPFLESAMLSNGEQSAANASSNELSICMQEFPEVMDTEYNGAQIRDYLDSRGIRKPWSAEHYADAIRWKMERGLLQLDQKALNEKKGAAFRAIAEQRKQAQHTEANMYEMPLEDLRRLGNGENFDPLGLR